MLDSWWLYRFFRITLLHPSGLVLDLVVEASGAVHGAVDGPISAVAVLVVRQLFGQLTSAVTRQLFQQPPVVGGDDGRHVRHRPVRELHRVAVEDPPEDMADRKALVQDVEEDLAQLGGHGGVKRRVESQDLVSPPPP